MNLKGMAKVYFNLVKKGLRTIDKVPNPWHDPVKAAIEAEQQQASENQEGDN